MAKNHVICEVLLAADTIKASGVNVRSMVLPVLIELQTSSSKDSEGCIRKRSLDLLESLTTLLSKERKVDHL